MINDIYLHYNGFCGAWECFPGNLSAKICIPAMRDEMPSRRAPRRCPPERRTPRPAQSGASSGGRGRCPAAAPRAARGRWRRYRPQRSGGTVDWAGKESDCVYEKSLPFRRREGCQRWHPLSYLIAKDHRSLGKSVDLAGQTGLLARRAVLVVYVVRSRLIDRLACERKEGFRFISVSSLNGVEDAAGSRAHTGLLSGVLRMALCVGFHTKDRSFDVRQVIHPLVFRTILEYDSTRRGKKQPLFPRRGAFLATGAAGMI